MKCISIRQPFASLIVAGIKDIENRSWITPYRGKVLVHAAQKVDKKGMELAKQMLGAGFVKAIYDYTGGIIGEVEIIDCVKHSDSDWFEKGFYGFVLRNAKVLPFYPCRGRLGIFELAA
jgi:hypothetical protein